MNLFNESITYDENNIGYHIAKHLYFVFDYKKLENKVFVKNIYNNNLNIKVYEGAKSDILCDYTLLDGKYYRENSILNSNKYGKKVTFRRDILDNKEMEIIANNIINCVWIISITYLNFVNINVEIISMFSKLISINYEISYEVFYYEYIKPKIYNMSIFNSKEENSITSQYNYNVHEKINDIIIKK